MTRLPCGCGIAWLTTGGPQEPANVRAPPVFRRHSANERPGWLLCEAHRRGVAMAPHLPELRGHFEALWLRAQSCAQGHGFMHLARRWADDAAAIAAAMMEPLS